MLYSELEKIAYEKSHPFCYTCYIKAIPTKAHGTRCPKCFSDDNMRITDDDGPEYGVAWIIPRLLEENCRTLRNVDLESQFLEMLNDCYDQVEIGGYKWDHGEAFKRLDEIAFHQELLAYIDTETDETIVTFDNGNSYYEISEIEQFIEAND